MALSVLKPLGQLELIMVKHFIELPSKKIEFLLIRSKQQKKQDAQRSQKGCCLFLIFSETTGPIGTKLGRNDQWMILLKIDVFIG
jgi:hypothetical protein